MKKWLPLLPIFALIGSSITFSIVNKGTQIVKASTTVEGHYARTGDDTSKSALYFYTEENAAPYNEDLSVKYKPVTNDAITLVKENGDSLPLPAAYAGSVDVFAKATATQYLLDNSIFNDIGGLDVGDTIVLNGNFINTANDVILHVKESKFYIDSDTRVNTLPHMVNDVSTYFSNAVATHTKPTYEEHTWAPLFWLSWTGEEEYLPFTIMPMTGESIELDFGYYPTSKYNFYVNGEPVANTTYDLVRRRDDWGNEIYLNLLDQLGSPDQPVGTFLVIDGLFTYKTFENGKFPKNPTLSLEPGEYFGIQINMFAAFKTGPGRDDYEVVDLKEYLADNFDRVYDYSVYEIEDYQQLRTIKANLRTNLQSASSAKEAYEIYNASTEEANQLTVTTDGLLAFKEAKKEEVRNYVSVDNYFDAEKITVQNYMDSACAQIDSATTTEQILNIVLTVEANIDTVSTRVDIMSAAILNKEAGYEQYLQSYDIVTLNDLSLGDSVTFHGRKDERDGEINTNVTDRTQFNTFTPNPENKNGNLIFNFTYQSNCTPAYGGNLAIVLRGVKYYGYKYMFGTDSKGLYFVKIESGKPNVWVKGFENIFINSTRKYQVSIGLIDLVEGNKTWATIKVGNNLIFEDVIDSLTYCTNPRVSLSNNDDNRSDVNGTTTIGNYYPSTYEDRTTPIYGGIFQYEEGHEDITSNLYFTLDKNELKYDKDKKLLSYATKESNIKYTRGNNTYDLSKTNIPVIAKYSETNYQLFLSSLFNNTITGVQNGDKLTISGTFVYFDETDSSKVAFEIANSVFTYNSVENIWIQTITLDDVKADTIRKLNTYTSNDVLDKYDETEQNRIREMVTTFTNNVNNATSIDAVKGLYEDFQDLIKDVLTTFEKYRQSKITSINDYLANSRSSYYDDDWQEILDIKASTIAEINEATSYKDIDKLYDSAISKINEVLTINQHFVQDLNNAKHSAIQAVKDHYAKLNLNKMSDEQIAALNADTLETIENIKNAASIPQVQNLLKEYKARHKLPNTNPSKQGCGGNIYVTSVLLSTLSLMGIGLLIYKKRKEDLEGF